MASRRPSSARRPEQTQSTPSSHHSFPNSVSAGDRTGTTGVDENEDFVRYIMQGSGVENDVDFAVLRRELDTSSSTSPSASKLQSYHNSTTTADSSPSVYAERGRTRKRDGEAERAGNNRKASDVKIAPAERNRPSQKQASAHSAQAHDLPPPPAALQRVLSTEPNPSETDTQPIPQRARAPSYSQNRARDGPRSAPAAPANPDDEYAPEFVVDPPRSRGTSDYGGRAPLTSIDNVGNLFGDAKGNGNFGSRKRDDPVNPAAPNQDAKAFRGVSSVRSGYTADGNHGHAETQDSHVDEPPPRQPANDRHRPPTLSRASSARSNYSQQPESSDVARNDSHRPKSYNPASHMQAHVERHDEAQSFWRPSGSRSANSVSPGSLQYEQPRSGYPVGAEQHQHESQSSHVSAKLQETSSQLFSAGFPRLHPSLMHTRPTPANADAEVLTERQADALRATVGYLLSELNRKNDLVQDLHTRAAEAEEERSKVLERTQRMYTHRQREAGADLHVIEQLQHSLRSSNSETKMIESNLVAAQATVADLRARCEQLEKQRKVDGEQTEKLRMMLADSAEKAEKTRQRNERTFAQITGQYERNPNKSGLDRLTLEVINVYEETLAKTRAELAELRKQNAKARSGQVGNPPPTDTRHSSQHGNRPGSAHRDSQSNGASPVDPIAEQRAREPSSNNRSGALESAQDEESQSALARAMGQQVNSLTARLAATSAALAESQKENDLLNLRLLATKKTEWTRGRGEPPPVGERGHGSGLQTRDLIRMDKQAYRLRLYKIDGLDVAACRELLKVVCVRFECNDVTALPAVLERVEICLRLVPQMDQFIQDVASIVKEVSTRIVGDGGNPVPQAEVYHRLPHLKSALQDWAKKMPDVEVLKDFRTRVHRALSLPQTLQSSNAVFEEIARLQTRGKLNQWSSPPPMTTAQSESAAATLAINRFRDLFQLRPDDDVLARMNQLFVFCDDANSGIAKLRAALDMDASAPPARVLLRAVDAVRSLGELSDAMRRSVRRTSIDRLQQAQDRRKSPDAGSRAEYQGNSQQTQQHQPLGHSPDPFATAEALQNRYQEPEYHDHEYDNDAQHPDVEPLPSPPPIISALPTLQQAWRNRAVASQNPHGGRSGGGGPSTTTTATENLNPQPFSQYGGWKAQPLEEDNEDVDEYGLKPIDQRGGNLDQTQQFRARRQGDGRQNTRRNDNSDFNTPGAFARGAASPPPQPDFGIERLTEERRPAAASAPVLSSSSSATSLAPPPRPASPPQISPTARRMRDAAEHGYTGLDMLLGATKTQAASTGELLLGDDATSGLAASMEDENDDLGRRAISPRPQHNQPPGEFLNEDRGDKIFGSANDATMLLEQNGMEGGDLSFGEFDEGDESLGVGHGADRRGFSPSF
ncbi:hypothetical protein HDU88_008460 [Geranomyces variabilis]|nr:hypothetical protein HDU88_008460 [Geranomyces variabilis]